MVRRLERVISLVSLALALVIAAVVVTVVLTRGGGHGTSGHGAATAAIAADADDVAPLQVGPAANPFVRGPFLTRLDETSATIALSARPGTAVELRAVGLDGGGVLARNGRFSGLRPGWSYSWTAAVAGIIRQTGSFTTAPRDLARPVTFDLIGDYGSGNEHEWAVGAAMAATHPDFVLTAGDNSYLLASPRLLDQNLFRPLHDVMTEAPLWATLGEHDLAWDDARDLIAALHSPGDGRRYDVGYGPIQVVAIGLEAGAAEQSYARAALTRPGPQVRFLLVHRPVLPGNPLLPFLRAHGVVILSGHLHRYERRTTEGVAQIVSGVGGQGHSSLAATPRGPGAVVSLLQLGFVRVTVDTRSTRFAFVDEAGRVLDRWTQPHATG